MSNFSKSLFEFTNTTIQNNTMALLSGLPAQTGLGFSSPSGTYFGPDGQSGIYRTIVVPYTENPNPGQGQANPAVSVDALPGQVRQLPGFTPIIYYTRDYDTFKGRITAIVFDREGVGAASGFSVNVEGTIKGETPNSYSYGESNRDLTTAQFLNSLQTLNVQPNFANYPDGKVPSNPISFFHDLKSSFTGRLEKRHWLRGTHHSGGQGTPYENEDPVWFGFEVVIDGASSPLFNGEILNFMLEIGGRIGGGKGAGNAEIINRKPILDSFCFEAMKFFKFSPAPYVENRSLLDSLFANEPEKKELLRRLPLYDIYQTFLEKKHYVKKIDGLETLNERNTANKSASFVKYGEDLIKLSFYEDITLSTGSLLNLYKLLAWSRKSGKSLIPDNLLKFDCEIIITEVRNIARVRSALAVELHEMANRQTIQPGDTGPGDGTAPKSQQDVSSGTQPTNPTDATPNSVKVEPTYTAESVSGTQNVVVYTRIGSELVSAKVYEGWLSKDASSIGLTNREIRRLSTLEAQQKYFDAAIAQEKQEHSDFGIELKPPYVQNADNYRVGSDIVVVGKSDVKPVPGTALANTPGALDASVRQKQQDEFNQRVAQQEKAIADLEQEQRITNDIEQKGGFVTSAQSTTGAQQLPDKPEDITDFQKWMNDNADGQSFTAKDKNGKDVQKTWKNTGVGPNKSADGVYGSMTTGAWQKFGQTYLNSKRVGTPDPPAASSFTPEQLLGTQPAAPTNPFFPGSPETAARTPLPTIEELPRLSAAQQLGAGGIAVSPLVGPLNQGQAPTLVATTDPIPEPTIIGVPESISGSTPGRRQVKESPKNSVYSLQVIKENLSKYRYKLYQCQFHVPTLPHPASIDLGKPMTSYEDHTIEISFKHSELSFERFDFKNLNEDDLGFENGSGFGVENAGSDHGKYFVLDNGENIPYNPSNFQSELGIKTDAETGNPSIVKVAAKVPIEPLDSLLFDNLAGPGVIDNFSRSQRNFKNVVNNIVDESLDAAKNLLKASKRVVLSEAQKLARDQFNLLKTTVKKVQTVYGVGISPPKNVYDGGLKGALGLQNAVNNFIGPGGIKGGLNGIYNPLQPGTGNPSDILYGGG
jgi:hypothetical protein